MASGRMEFHAQSIMQHANFAFAIPNDTEMEEVRDLRHYQRPMKSLILLHGLTGTDTDWMYGGLAQELALQYNVAIFMPTVGNSFYLDRGYAGGNYGTYVGKELPEYIRQVFGLCESRENTMIGGLSMGGYGAIHTALAFPENFSACIALSSALHLEEIAAMDPISTAVMPEGLLREVFGDSTGDFSDLLTSTKNPQVQYQNLARAAEADALATAAEADTMAAGHGAAGEGRSTVEIPSIYMACGTEDSLLDANRRFAEFLEGEKADYLFETGPGEHRWRFWNEYMDRGLAWVLR